MYLEHQWVFHHSHAKKKDRPSIVSDYRPISLLNCSIKLITKLLANRLQRRIMELIHLNQYGFIKIRTIQDCLAQSFQYLHMCYKSKKDLIILKLYFEKAFDKVEHQFMLDVMKHKSFGPRRMQMIFWFRHFLNSFQWSTRKKFSLRTRCQAR